MVFAQIMFCFVKTVICMYTGVTFPICALCCHCGVPSPSEEAAKSKVKVVSRSKHAITFRSIAISCPRREEILGINTMAEMFAFIVRKYGNCRAMGTRKILREEKEKAPDGRELNKVILGEYSWLTYNEVAIQAQHFGKGLRELCGLRAGARIGIFADTRAEWMIAATGCFGSRFTLCTLYTNLGEDGIIYGITQTEVTTMVTSIELLPKLLVVKDRIPLVKHIIFFENPLRPHPKSEISGILFYSFTTVLQKGKNSSLPTEVPESQDTAVIMYTSGSTGVPKGVQLSNKNMVSGISSLLNAASAVVEENGPAGPDDTYIAFLPLAHVLEMLAEHVMLLMGIKVGYSSPNTLTDKGTMIKTGEKGDAPVLRPTIMATVPLVLDRVYKGIKNTIAEKGAFSQLLVNYCFEYRTYWAGRGYGTPIMDALIFSKMKAILGGQMRVVLCGGAPLSDDAHSFVRTALTCKLLQGYGLTETTSTATIGDARDLTTGQVGPPLLGVDLRLEDWAEAGYTINDTIGPRGEIIVGGDNVSDGYFSMKTKTREDFFTEGGKQFFRTGDIGQVLPNGTLKIIDRKKDLVKLQAGEYVSLGKVEVNLKLLGLIENICVYGDSRHTATVALVIPDDDKLHTLAMNIGKKGSRMQLCKDPAVVKAVYDTMVKHAAAVHLEKFEIPGKICLIPEPWTPESGLVTAAFKLKRRPIQIKYQAELDEMYKKLNMNDGSVSINMKGGKKNK